MKSRIYWGIATLIVLLIGVSVFLLIRNTDTAPEKVYRGDVEPTLKKPPDGPGYTWVLHGDHWDKVPIPEADTGKQHLPVEVAKEKPTPGVPNQKTPTRLVGSEGHDYYYDRVYKKYGVDPPPPGYAYRMSDPGVLRLDENGNPILKKIGEPVFDIVKVPGFAPTLEQYQHYKELIRKRDHERRTGNDAAADQFNAEIRQLKAEAQGLIPIVSSSQLVPSHLSETARAKRDRLSSEIMRQAYIDMGLGHMVSH